MPGFRRLARLSPVERRLLIRAVVAVAVVRVGLTLLPFRILPGLLARRTRARPRTAGVSRENVAWAVGTASRYVPRATCLTQALAAQLLLAGEGEASRLHVGVARASDGTFRAHAWLESEGRIVIGGSGTEVRRYVPLLALDATGS